jgi:hypothetical protein
MLYRLLFLPLLALASFGDVQAQTPSCTIEKSGGCSSGHVPFEIVAKASDPRCPAGVKSNVCPNEAIEAEAECYNVMGGMTCDGWARETQPSGKLAYNWSIEIDGVPTPMTEKSVTFACDAGQNVIANLTVSNGSGTDTVSASATCDPSQTTPLAPFGPSVEWAGCYGRNNVSWLAASGNEEFYILQRRTWGTPTWQTVYNGHAAMAQVEVSYTSDIRVSACNWHGCSSWKYGSPAQHYPQCPTP